jgi:hypothetical protein
MSAPSTNVAIRAPVMWRNRAMCRPLVWSQESSSFLKKRTKKLLNALRGLELEYRPEQHDQWIEVFWFFFSKKNRFLLLIFC